MFVTDIVNYHMYMAPWSLRVLYSDPGLIPIDRTQYCWGPGGGWKRAQVPTNFGFNPQLNLEPTTSGLPVAVVPHWEREPLRGKRA